MIAMQTDRALENGNRGAERHAQAVVERSRTSFFWAMRRMEPIKRQAMYAIYAFCREIDDIADEPGEADGKRAALEAYRQDVDALYRGGKPKFPAVMVLAAPTSAYTLPKSDFDALIDGMLTDAQDAVRIADDGDLALYIDRVACTVGRLSCRIFGIADAEQAPLAKALGSALQLTNILRDVREDAARNRVYLPATRLAEAGIAGTDPLALADHPAIAAVCMRLADQASAHFSAADRLMDRCAAADVRPARMMRAAYGRLLERVVEAGFVPFPKTRVSLNAFEKAAMAIRYGLF